MLSVFYRHDKVQQIEALSVNLPIYFGRDVSPSLIYLHLMGLYNFFIYLKLNFCFILIQACFSVHNFSDMYLKYIIPFCLLSGSHVKAQVGQETYYGKDLDYEHYDFVDY